MPCGFTHTGAHTQQRPAAMPRPSTLTAIAIPLGWAAVALSVLILLVFATIRLLDMTAAPPSTDLFAVRYVQHPGVALLHILPGLVFLTLGPLQFVARIRRQRIGLHRLLGRVLVPCAAVSGVFALVASFRFPAFGGVSTQAATLFFGPIFLFSLAKAFRHIRRKEISLHREWMIRVFALAMGVASIRVFIGLFQAIGGLGIEEVFGTTFWLGFGVNLVAAEVWINVTRR